MADSIGQAYVQILPTTKGFSSKLSSELGNSSGGLAGAGKSLGGKILKGIAAVGIGAAITKGIKSSINAGGELQQNLGGTEAVYGKFASNIQKTATEAYKNMGLSASDYMATANKMGSLFQGSGVKQERAVKLTSDAMQRAADVASVMGLDTTQAMESIAGAAKGNFTMMDNLGVAMNATTLQAYALEKGINFDWKTADNAEKAELAMKMFMDRTSQYQGNFAKESEQTLTGSIGAMKSLITDLMGNLSLGTDITPQLSALLETAKAFLLKNLFPMISNVITGVANNAGQLGNIISSLVFAIGDLLIKSAPKLLKAGIQLIVQLGQGLIKGLPKLIPQVTKLITDLALMLTKPDNLAALISTGLDLIMALSDGLLDAMPVLMRALPQIITNVVVTLIQLAPKLATVAIKLLTQLGRSMLTSFSVLGVMILRLGENIIKAFSKIDWKKIGTDILEGIKKGLNNAKESLLSTIRKIADLLPNAVKKLLKIGSPSKVFESMARWIPIGMALGISKNSHYVDSAVEDMVSDYSLLSSRGMSMSVSTKDTTSAFSYAGIYEAIKKGASEAQPVLILNGRVLSRELKGMGVAFA